MQALDVARPRRLEGRAQRSRKARSLRRRSRLSNTSGHAPRAQLGADKALVEVHAGELGEALVDGVGEGEDTLGDLPGRRDDHHHDEPRLQREDLDVAQRRRGDRRRGDHGQQLGDARQRLGGLAQRVVDLARGAVPLQEDRRRGRAATLGDDDVDVVAVAGVGGHPPRGGVRVRQHAHVLEVGEVVADGRRGHAEVMPLAEVLGPDRRAERDVFLDDGPQDLLLPSRERQSTPLNAESETGARTPRRPRASPFASRGLYHCAGKPIQRRQGCAATSWSTTAATSASGTRSPQRAARRKRSRARVSGSSVSGRARRRLAGAERRRPRDGIGGVRPPAGADGAHGARPETEVGPGAPVRHVVARPPPRQSGVADLVPVVAGAGELPTTRR